MLTSMVRLDTAVLNLTVFEINSVRFKRATCRINKKREQFFFFLEILPWAIIFTADWVVFNS